MKGSTSRELQGRNCTLRERRGLLTFQSVLSATEGGRLGCRQAPWAHAFTSLIALTPEASNASSQIPYPAAFPDPS